MTQPQTQPQTIGELTQSEMDTLNQIRGLAQQIVHQIGSLEVEKSRLLGQLGMSEQQIRQHLQKVGNRLEIPQGAGWQVVGNKAMLISPAPEAEPPAAEPDAQLPLKLVEPEPEAAPQGE